MSARGMTDRSIGRVRLQAARVETAQTPSQTVGFRLIPSVRQKPLPIPPGAAGDYDTRVKTESSTDLRRTLGRDPVVEAYKAGIDRTLLRDNLRLTVEERLRRLVRLQDLAEELQRAGRAAKARP